MQSSGKSSSDSSGSSQSLSSTLLDGLRNRDASAWSRFERIMGPVIRNWCATSGLQPSDADDVVQQVFQAIMAGVERFRRERPGDSFRGWAWTITQNKIRDFFRKQEKDPDAFGGTDANRRFQQLLDDGLSDSEPSPEDSRCLIVAHALEVIRGDFGGVTWEIFVRLAIKGESSVVIAADLGMKQNTVRRAKFRVLRRLREEVEELL